MSAVCDVSWGGAGVRWASMCGLLVRFAAVSVLWLTLSSAAHAACPDDVTASWDPSGAYGDNTYTLPAGVSEFRLCVEEGSVQGRTVTVQFTDAPDSVYVYGENDDTPIPALAVPATETEYRFTDLRFVPPSSSTAGVTVVPAGGSSDTPFLRFYRSSVDAAGGALAASAPGVFSVQIDFYDSEHLANHPAVTTCASHTTVQLQDGSPSTPPLRTSAARSAPLVGRGTDCGADDLSLYLGGSHYESHPVVGVPGLVPSASGRFNEVRLFRFDVFNTHCGVEPCISAGTKIDADEVSWSVDETLTSAAGDPDDGGKLLKAGNAVEATDLTFTTVGPPWTLAEGWSVVGLRVQACAAAETQTAIFESTFEAQGRLDLWNSAIVMASDDRRLWRQGSAQLRGVTVVTGNMDSTLISTSLDNSSLHNVAFVTPDAPSGRPVRGGVDAAEDVVLREFSDVFSSYGVAECTAPPIPDQPGSGLRGKGTAANAEGVSLRKLYCDEMAAVGASTLELSCEGSDEPDLDAWCDADGTWPDIGAWGGPLSDPDLAPGESRAPRPCSATSAGDTAVEFDSADPALDDSGDSNSGSDSGSDLGVVGFGWGGAVDCGRGASAVLPLLLLPVWRSRRRQRTPRT